MLDDGIGAIVIGSPYMDHVPRWDPAASLVGM